MAKKVIVAMSGGVDSSLAAALLLEAGYDAIGVHMRLHSLHAATGSRATAGGGRLNHGCCSVEDVDDARLVAHTLGIPFYVLNFEPEFRRYIIGNFIGEYRRGRTPYPCLNCNRYVKFDALLHRAESLGADQIATGHYARITQDATGRWHLGRARDRSKDQAYVLYHLGQAELARVLLPLGDLEKTEVRRLAAARGMVVADKPDSQEICFVPSNNYREFLDSVAPQISQPGPILDSAGHEVGRHEGITGYTIGQRKGLGALGADPHYVLRLDPARNAVIVGTADELQELTLVAEDVHFVTGIAPTEPLPALAKIRYRAPEAPALVTPLSDGRVRVDFATPQRAITPGQAVVFYQDDEVIGGGTIAAAGVQAADAAA
jgi:tRNA-specific 2-thiouridylase